MNPIRIDSKTAPVITATISQWRQSDGSIRFVMTPHNGGRVKVFKTLDGAFTAGERYVDRRGR